MSTSTTVCDSPPPTCNPPITVLDVSANVCVSAPPCQNAPDNSLCTASGTTCAGASVLVKDVGTCGGAPGTPATGSSGASGGSGSSGTGGDGGAGGSSGSGGTGGSGGSSGTSAGSGGSGGSGGGGGQGGTGGQGGNGGEGGKGGDGGQGGQGGQGGVTDISPVVSAIDRSITASQAHTDTLGGKIDGVGAKVDAVGGKLDGTNTTLGDINGKLDGLGDIGNKLDGINGTLKGGVACPEGQSLYMGNCTASGSSNPLDSGGSGTFGGEAQDALDSVTADYTAKIQQIQEGLAAFVPGSEASDGELPDIPLGNFLGVDVGYNLSQWSVQLSIIGMCLLFLAYIIAFTIIMGKK
ncbi:MAG: hypothetical protein WAW36_08265 [Methylovulum miyakonense]|uniref:hypothetical protein n=1 Tax=Methylovulum miyakonense TaxID=645578 RepID=UPI003BB4893C